MLLLSRRRAALLLRPTEKVRLAGGKSTIPLPAPWRLRWPCRSCGIHYEIGGRVMSNPKKRASLRNRTAKKKTPRRPVKRDSPADARAHASVIVRAASGKSVIKDLGRITPQNVKSYLPATTSLEE